MKDVNTFIETMVKIDHQEDFNCFGHYPFQMLAETNDDKLIVSALALGGDVRACYRTFKKHLSQKSKRIYMSLDFPKGGDIENDFIAIFHYENGEFKISAIPYNTEDGVKFESISKSEHLNKLFDDFKSIVN